MKASCWDFVAIERKSPMPRPLRRKTEDAARRAKRLPRSGTPKRNVPVTHDQDQLDEAEPEGGDELADDDLDGPGPGRR